jgi:CspA family cold shock protein
MAVSLTSRCRNYLPIFLKPVTTINYLKFLKGASVMAERKQGTVKWFNNSKGYGFISQEGGEDVFVHFDSIVGDGYKSLEENAKVEFTITQGPKGLQAAEVKIIH